MCVFVCARADVYFMTPPPKGAKDSVFLFMSYKCRGDGGLKNLEEKVLVISSEKEKKKNSAYEVWK